MGGGVGGPHGLRELTGPGVNWKRRMEKHRKGGMGAEEAPAGNVGLGRAQYRAEPRDCPR